jgi:alanyl-tRNA synthetase
MEILKQNGMNFTQDERNLFETEFQKHKDLSRTTSAGIFRGGLASKSDKAITSLHTATHLLHASLRKILGEHVSQKGSHITNERLRFDFSHPGKLSESEIGKVEDLINEQVRKDLPVTNETMALPAAIKKGALHFFADKYGEKVKVYSIGSFSKEICGGPHVTHTGEIGRVKIIKQEKIGSGIIRIYAGLGK